MQTHLYTPTTTLENVTCSLLDYIVWETEKVTMTTHDMLSPTTKLFAIVPNKICPLATGNFT